MPENTSNQSDYHSLTKALGICRYMERPHIIHFFKDQKSDQNELTCKLKFIQMNLLQNKQRPSLCSEDRLDDLFLL